MQKAEVAFCVMYFAIKCMVDFALATVKTVSVGVAKAFFLSLFVLLEAAREQDDVERHATATEKVLTAIATILAIIVALLIEYIWPSPMY